ncbi:3-methyl-2-oxobutanoate hydroxymethyltransferase [Hydrogenobaculum acidophilum]
MTNKLNIELLFKKKKNHQKITMVSLSSYISAKICEEAGIDTILVGDSLGMVFKGEPNTLGVTLEEMIYHAKAVKKGAPNTFTIVDMPFMSYQSSVEEAIKNCGLAIKETKADAVKIEGGSYFAPLIEKLTKVGIPVCAHIGFTPQWINTIGKFRFMGKTEEEKNIIKEDFKSVVEAGAFMVVFESIPRALARELTSENAITIGIGAGADTDGQVLVFEDIVGLVDFMKPKFVKRYTNGYQIFLDAVKSYKKEVEEKVFPSEEHIY